MFRGIDLFSDTITRPSSGMKHAMMDAALGDEQQGEDPTTTKLEERMAHMLGKSAALFFPSATMCNQVAAMIHCQPGDEVIGAEQSHVFTSEGGGFAFHARAQARPIPTKDGTFFGHDLKRFIRISTRAHVPKSALVVVENTMNGGGGTVWALDQLTDVVDVAKSFGLKTHLDGARLFNAAVASKTEIATIAQGFDSVTLCFSKGLGCAMGAVFAFDKADWTTVRRLKQVFGGAMRQSGILAAACLYALDHHVSQIATDHAHAERLAKGLCAIDGVTVENDRPASNMVYFSVNETQISAEQFAAACIENGVRFSQVAPNRFRAVTHRDVDENNIEQACAIVRTIMSARG